MKKICAPSFVLEKTTHAANNLVLGVVLLVGMFSFAGVYCMLSCMMISINDCLTFYNYIPLGVMMAYTLGVLIPCIVLPVKGLSALSTSYAIAPCCITKGTLRSIPDHIEVDPRAGNAASAAVAGVTLAANLGTAATINGVNAAANVGTLITRIQTNTMPSFAETYFDTDCYKKKDYQNPVRVKETKYAYIYRCEKNKKLVIAKLYTNMGLAPAEQGKGQGIAKRIAKGIGLSFVAALLASALTVGIALAGTNTYRQEVTPIIEQTIADLGETLAPLGYAYEAPYAWASEKLLTDATFSYHNEEIEATYLDNEITYDFAQDGSIERIAFEIYFTAEDATVAEQVFAVLDTAPNRFSQATRDEMAAAIIATQEGSYIHNAMLSDDGKCSIKVSRYNDCYYIRTTD